jgi:hypothetical protein
VLTRMARGVCTPMACEPDGELTGGTDTGVQPVTGLGRPVRSWPPRGPPGQGATWPELGRARGPAQRAGPQDHPRSVKGLLIEQESSDAAAKGIEQCRRASSIAEVTRLRLAGTAPRRQLEVAMLHGGERGPARARKAQREIGVRA